MQSFSSLTSVSTFRGWSRDRVIENGVDMVALRKVIGEPVSQSLPQEKSSDLIWIGRVCEQKNIELFIQYLKTPRAKGLEVTIVCDRPDFVSNFMQIGEPCMANVRVFEFVEQKDLWTMMLATKVYVSSSRYEGYGNIIGEAVALGMQVVLPFIEPLTSLYPSTAFFYVPLDIDALSDSIDLAIAEERTLGPQTRSVHTMEAASKHLEMLYHEYA